MSIDKPVFLPPLTPYDEPARDSTPTHTFTVADKPVDPASVTLAIPGHAPARGMSYPRKTRLQADLTEEQITQLDALVGKLGASSRAEVVRRALDLMTFLVAETDGGEASVEIGDKTVRLIFF